MSLIRTSIIKLNRIKPAGDAWLRKADRAVRQWAVNSRVTSSRSQRSRKKVSRPGQPPSARRKWIKRNMRWARKAPGVYVMGVIAGRRRSRLPRVLELGGYVRVPARRVEGRRVPGRVVRIQARPFLRPAVEKERHVVRRILAGGR